MDMMPKFIKRRQELKGKSEEERMRLKRYYRREDATAKEIKHQRKMAELRKQTELEELKERKEKSKAQRRQFKSSHRIRLARPSLRISHKALKLPK